MALYLHLKNLGFRWQKMIRHPKEYLVIVDCNKLDKVPYDIHTVLRRLNPDTEMPPGYLAITKFRNTHIYDKDGKLLPKFWALKRYNRALKR